MFKRKVMPVVLAVAVSLLTGCQIIALSVATVAAAVGLAGYAVYKTGEAAVTGVGKAAKATGNMFSSGAKSATTVIYANGDFKTEINQDVPTLWNASSRALQKARFDNVRGSYDALSGKLTARTVSDNTEIVITLKSLTSKSTEISIRVGLKGDLQKSEVIHGLILRELPAAVVPAPESVQKEEVKS